jgi:UDP-glucose 4-epimerase
MKVLITGGLGYLGGRIAQHLEANTDYKIFLGTRKKNVSHYSFLNSSIIQTLWNSSIELDQLCKNIDLVIHCAGMNANDCIANPKMAFEVNGNATSMLLKSCIKNKVKRFIYFSTAHVYDSPLEGKFTEFSRTINPHPYATSHKLGEDAVRIANSKEQIEGIIIRLSNSFGRPMDINANCWTLLTNDLCKQAIEKRSMTLTSKKIQRRDFISITNLCRAVEHLAKISKNNLDNGLFNVGGEWTPTILDIANLIAERTEHLLGIKIPIKTSRAIQNLKPKDLDFDISKLKLTNFKLVDNQINEIDNLILFCSKFFNR